MGHLRTASLPDTEPWRRVVALVAEGAEVGSVASATMEAAKKGLEKSKGDPGLCHAVHLLTQLVLAARTDNFAGALTLAGINTPSEPTTYDIIGGFSDAIDAHLRRTGGRTDISEMAQVAASECLSAHLKERSKSLFGTTSAEVQSAVYEASTKQGFSTLAHSFFSRFTQRFLTYHLDRELSNHVGGNGRFSNTSAHNQFNAQLAVHCREAALIVRKFAGGWYSKAHFEGGISATKSRNFTNYCLTKLRRELSIRGKRDAD